MRKMIMIPLLIVAISVNSCSKKEGCTDSESVSYNSDAKKDDGSCQYEGSVSFWFNQGISGVLNSYNASVITIYIENSSSGEIKVEEWKSGPDCGGENLTIKKVLGELKSKEFSYSAKDQNGTEQFKGKFTISSNNCANVELHW